MSYVERWVPLTGVIAVVLLFVAVAVLRDQPAVDGPGSEWTAYFEDSGNRAQTIVSSILLVLASFAFLAFFWALSARLGSSEEGQLRFSNLALASGAVVTVALATAGALGGAVAFGHEFDDYPLPSPEIMLQIDNIGGAIVVLVGGYAASMFVGASSIAALRGGALPTWLGWLGVVIAIVLLFSFLFLPLVLFLLWVLIVSVVQVVQPQVVQPQVAQPQVAQPSAV